MLAEVGPGYQTKFNGFQKMDLKGPFLLLCQMCLHRWPWAPLRDHVSLGSVKSQVTHGVGPGLSEGAWVRLGDKPAIETDCTDDFVYIIDDAMNHYWGLAILGPPFAKHSGRPVQMLRRSVLILTVCCRTKFLIHRMIKPPHPLAVKKNHTLL